MDSISGVDRLTDGRAGAEAATPAAARWRQDGGAAAALGASLTGTTTCAARLAPPPRHATQLRQHKATLRVRFSRTRQRSGPANRPGNGSETSFLHRRPVRKFRVDFQQLSRRRQDLLPHGTHTHTRRRQTGLAMQHNRRAELRCIHCLPITVPNGAAT